VPCAQLAARRCCLTNADDIHLLVSAANIAKEHLGHSTLMEFMSVLVSQVVYVAFVLPGSLNSRLSTMAPSTATTLFDPTTTPTILTSPDNDSPIVVQASIFRYYALPIVNFQLVLTFPQKFDLTTSALNTSALLLASKRSHIDGQLAPYHTSTYQDFIVPVDGSRVTSDHTWQIAINLDSSMQTLLSHVQQYGSSLYCGTWMQYTTVHDATAGEQNALPFVVPVDVTLLSTFVLLLVVAAVLVVR
jgi:hypothetical protein